MTMLHDVDSTDDQIDAVDDHLSRDAQISRDVGARLRALREQRQMSLHDVEQFSEGRFVPSTIGAYERGERSISLPRLQCLAELYGVPVEQLLPESSNQSSARRSSPIDEPLRLDLTLLYQLRGDGFSALIRFVDSIRSHRGDTDSQVCTLRGADALVVSALIDVPVDQVVPRLRALDLSPVV